MHSKRLGGWYVRKTFPHFDLPLPFPQALELVSSPERVATHSFLPLIAFTDVKRRFTPESSVGKFKNKVRELRYCSHRDGYIHSYYSFQLQAAYENRLKLKEFGSSVLGYRSGLGNNLDMAADAIYDVRNRGTCMAIAIDITDFFPSIDHGSLKRNLMDVLNAEQLSSDWFSVFKSMTKYSWIEQKRIAEIIDRKVRDLPRPICEIAEFRELRRGYPDLIRRNSSAMESLKGRHCQHYFLISTC
jgi:hypothetical protein